MNPCLTCRVRREPHKYVLTDMATGKPVKLTGSMYRKLCMVVCNVALANLPDVVVHVHEHGTEAHKYYTMSLGRVS